MSFMGGASRMLQWGLQSKCEDGNLTTTKGSFLGPVSVTRNSEFGIVSNRLLECHGDFVPVFCTYRLSPPGRALKGNAFRD